MGHHMTDPELPSIATIALFVAVFAVTFALLIGVYAP